MNATWAIIGFTEKIFKNQSYNLKFKTSLIFIYSAAHNRAQENTLQTVFKFFKPHPLNRVFKIFGQAIYKAYVKF